MGNENIKIIVGGDVSGLTSEVKKANEALGTFTGLTNQTSSSLRKVATESQNAAKSIKEVAKSTEKVFQPGSIDEARATVKRLKDEITSLSGSQLNSESGKFLVGELSTAQKELKAMETQAGLTAQAVGGNLATKGFGLLRQAANILPGVGISGIIAGIGTIAIEVAGDLLKLSDAAKDASKDMAKSFAEAEGKAAGEQATLQSLVGIARNENLSKQARTEAINKLNQEYDKYLPKLSLENINTAAVTEEVNKLSATLLRQAKIKGLQDLISRETAKQADLLTNSLEDNANSWDKLVAVLKGAGTGAAGINFQLQVAGAERTGTAYKESADKIKVFNGALNELLTTDAKEGTLFTEKEKRQKKEVDLLQKRLDALQKIQQATKDATTRVGIQESIFELQTKITIRDAAKNGLSKTEVDQAIQGFQKELQKEFNNQAIELEAIPKVRFTQVVRAEINTKNVESEIAKATGLDKKLTIPTQFDIDLKFNGREFAESAERARKQIEGVKTALFNGIVNGIQEGAAVLGEAFGEILSGGGVTDALAKAAQGLLGIVGSILQDVGKQIILTSALVAALKKALDGIFGPGGEAIAAAVGVALIATGALLKSIKFDVPKLADGGIATRATLGVFGEAGREAIIPLDRLPEMVNKVNVNNQQPIVINGNMRINGTDLELMLQRVEGRRSRLG